MTITRENVFVLIRLLIGAAASMLFILSFCQNLANELDEQPFRMNASFFRNSRTLCNISLVKFIHNYLFLVRSLSVCKVYFIQ